MSGVNLTIDGFKGTFFDKKKVMDPVKRMWKRQLSRWAAHTRQTAKTSIRYSDKPAQPGKPPHAHKTATKAKRNKKTGVVKIQPISLLREYYLFGYEEREATAVVGPALLNGTSARFTSESTLPELMEYGGSATIVEEKTVRHAGKVPIVAKNARQAKYAPHPSARPAAAKETPKFMESLQDSVK